MGLSCIQKFLENYCTLLWALANLSLNGKIFFIFTAKGTLLSSTLYFLLSDPFTFYHFFRETANFRSSKEAENIHESQDRSKMQHNGDLASSSVRTEQLNIFYQKFAIALFTRWYLMYNWLSFMPTVLIRVFKIRTLYLVRSGLELSKHSLIFESLPNSKQIIPV